MLDVVAGYQSSISEYYLEENVSYNIAFSARECFLTNWKQLLITSNSFVS